MHLWRYKKEKQPNSWLSLFASHNFLFQIDTRWEKKNLCHNNTWNQQGVLFYFLFPFHCFHLRNKMSARICKKTGLDADVFFPLDLIDFRWKKTFSIATHPECNGCSSYFPSMHSWLRSCYLSEWMCHFLFEHLMTAGFRPEVWFLTKFRDLFSNPRLFSTRLAVRTQQQKGHIKTINLFYIASQYWTYMCKNYVKQLKLMGDFIGSLKCPKYPNFPLPVWPYGGRNQTHAFGSVFSRK